MQHTKQSQKCCCGLGFRVCGLDAVKEEGGGERESERESGSSTCLLLSSFTAPGTVTGGMNTRRSSMVTNLNTEISRARKCWACSYTFSALCHGNKEHTSGLTKGLERRRCWRVFPCHEPTLDLDVPQGPLHPAVGCGVAGLGSEGKLDQGKV
jgi:hypothetical protein